MLIFVQQCTDVLSRYGAMCNNACLITIMIVDGLSEFWKLTLSEDATLVQKPNPIYRGRYLNVTNTQ
jgi:hypothetical protein